MANNPRQGRAGAGGYSPRLGHRDPRLRSNQAGQVNDADLAPGSLDRDAAGATRISAFDAIKPLPASATAAEVLAQLNLILKRGKGR